MVTFFITTEERRRAQDRAAELDVSKSNPPGTHPYVWDNRANSVKRWYKYGSPEGKLGTIYFQHILDGARQSSPTVECTTEITHHPLTPTPALEHVATSDHTEHERLTDLFFEELLDNTR